MSDTDNTPDLTTPANVAAGQEVYDQMVAGQVDDVTAALDNAYSRTEPGK